MRELALFDFDGTTTKLDSLDSFFKFISTKRTYLFNKYVLSLPHLLFYKLKIIDYHAVKYARIRFFFRKHTLDELLEKSENFSRGILPSLLRDSAMQRIRWHQNLGHTVYIVSASIDLILKTWCQSQNVGLITNTLEIINGKCTGNFLLPDCNGAEKVRRIKQMIVISDFTKIYAYGDTEMDLPMLELADEKYYCFFE